jgi:YD repeat-containing protein
MLKKSYVRDGSRKTIASITTGYSDSSSVVRDERNKVTGRTNDRFRTTRDAHGNVVSVNSPDPGLLIGTGKQR